jgi:hypothetical protein
MLLAVNRRCTEYKMENSQPPRSIPSKLPGVFCPTIVIALSWAYSESSSVRRLHDHGVVQGHRGTE